MRTRSWLGPGVGTGTSRSSSVVDDSVICIQYDCIALALGAGERGQAAKVGGRGHVHGLRE
jgi:hypothetical protein